MPSTGLTWSSWTLIDPNASNGPSSSAGFGVAIGDGSSRNTIYFARPSAGQWHLYTFVFNANAPAATEVTPYVDGQPVSFTQTMAGTGAGDFANSTLYWMSRDGSSLFGEGSMQDLAIYNQALSASTILSDYEVATGTGSSGTTTSSGSTTTTSPTTTTLVKTMPVTTTTTQTTTTGSSAGGPVTTPYAKAVLGTPGLIDYWRMGDAAGSSAFAPARYWPTGVGNPTHD